MKALVGALNQEKIVIVKTDFETIYRFTAVVLWNRRLSLHSKIYLVVERRNSYLQEGIQVGGGRSVVIFMFHGFACFSSIKIMFNNCICYVSSLSCTKY